MLVTYLLKLFITLVSSWGIGDFDVPTRKALTLTTASRNLALVLFIAVESFPQTDIEAGVIAFGLVELALILLVAMYFRWSCHVK